MLAHRFRRGSGPRIVGARLRRPAAVLTALACAVLAWATAVPAAFANTPKPQPCGGT